MTSAVWHSPASERRRSRLLGLFLPAFLVCYAAIGVGRMGKPEYYPFASWAMYSTVPNEITTYRLRVTAIGSRRITPPAYYASKQDVLTAPVRISTVVAIRRLGESIERGHPETTAQLRTIVERAVLPEGAAYDIVEQRFWPIEKWLHDRYRENVIASFRAEPRAQ